MAIVVVCPGCRSRFQVSDKFAGKQGPCPKCKKVLTVPSLDEEVKIHEPEQYGGAKDAKGRHVLKPIARTETKLQPVAIVGMVAGTLLALGMALIARGLDASAQATVLALGAVFVAPPTALAGYSFLRNQELEPYRGTSLGIRTALCSVVYAGLWGVFAVAKGMLFSDPSVLEPWSAVYLGAPILLVGALTALACFDLDFGSGFFHYSFYLLACILLRWLMGLPAL